MLNVNSSTISDAYLQEGAELELSGKVIAQQTKQLQKEIKAAGEEAEEEAEEAEAEPEAEPEVKRKKTILDYFIPNKQ